MKKKFYLFMVCIFVLLGCSCSKKSNINVNLEEKDLKNKYNSNIKIEINGNNLLSNLLVVNKVNMVSQLGFNIDDVGSYLALVGYHDDVESYIAVKPVDGKKEKVIKSLEFYLSNKKNRLNINETDEQRKEIVNKKIELLDNCLKTEYNGYIIYIVSENSNEAFELLKAYLN